MKITEKFLLFLITEKKVVMTFFLGSFNFIFNFLIGIKRSWWATVYGVVGLSIFGGFGDLV